VTLQGDVRRCPDDMLEIKWRKSLTAIVLRRPVAESSRSLGDDRGRTYFQPYGRRTSNPQRLRNAASPKTSTANQRTAHGHPEGSP